MILKKKPPLKTDVTVSDKTGKVTKKRAPKDGTEIVEQTQQFFATHTEKTVMIKFGNQSFGIKKDNGLERLMRGTAPKDNENIIKILDFLKSLMKKNVSFETICKRLNDTQTDGNYSQSIRTYYNALNKPVTPEKKVLTVTAVNTSPTLDTHPHINHFGDDNHGTHEHLHL